MAVLCQALNVIVKVDTINKKFPGGLLEYENNVPNRTYCCDGKLTRIGFMTPTDVGSWIEYLEKNGLVFCPGEEAIDICVVDEFTGPTTNCARLDQYRNNDNSYSYVCLAGEKDNNTIFPENCDLTPMKFVKTKDIDKIEMIGINGAIESYLIDGKEVFVGRTSDDIVEEEKNKTVKILKSHLKNKSL